MRHSKKANIWCWDGHVAATDKKDLRYMGYAVGNRNSGGINLFLGSDLSAYVNVPGH